MTEVLLKQLTNSDINWMITTGNRQEIPTGTTLIQQGQAADTLHILLDGTLTVTASSAENNPLSRVFAAIEGSATAAEREIFKLSSGEVVGEIPFVSIRPTATTVRAIQKSLVLSIPQQQLATKLQQDVGFAARFYRAIAILLSDRLQNIINQFGRNTIAQGQPLRDVLCVLGELNDSDIDWMMATGKPQIIPVNSVLIREGGCVDALYVLLGGTMSVSISENERNPLTRAFAAIEGVETPEREIARLSKGEIVGETPFIDTRLPSATVKALENSSVLAIPRQELATKLQQDVGFASRFYRVIATLLSNRVQGMLIKFGYSRRVYSQGQPLNENVKYEDELDLNVLEQMALAAKRFDWMQGRLRAS
jgi:bacteriocin-type transport-associated protein